MENSDTGYSEGKHWREASGWFSYQLRNKYKKAAYLYFSMLHHDKKVAYDVFINNTLVSVFNSNEGKGDKLTETFIPIAGFQTDETITVRIVAKEKCKTPRIVEVRLLERVPTSNL